MDVGLRVVRGPSWHWGDQDSGEGHVGTVVEIGTPESVNTPDKTVVVQWDSGARTNYRIGYQGAYDLRILDNAPIGIVHPNIVCNSCEKHGIAGIRWRCTVCPNFDMCTRCYMGDKHDLNHLFERFETADSLGVKMPKRSLENSVKLQCRGIFIGARVVRGYDWDWANQDGGDGKVGKVIDIRGWDNESRRSVANVMWASGSTNVYRLGHKGKVDLKYVIDTIGGYYYRDHLPILGQPPPPESLRRPEAASSASALLSLSPSSLPTRQHPLYMVNDKVKVIIEDEEELKSLQEGHGGWNPKMVNFIGQIGTVHRITDRGDIRVQFENSRHRWTFNPHALLKVTTYRVNDLVRVIDDANQIKELQKSHGEWIDQMHAILGKSGKVAKVYADGDLRVVVENQTWTLNPLCVTLEDRSALESVQQQARDVSSTLAPGMNALSMSQQEQREHRETPSMSPPAPQPPPVPQGPPCVICEENTPNIKFEPCSHLICCSGCCTKMKKCVKCHQVIERKVPVTEGDNSSLDHAALLSCIRSKDGSGKGNSENLLETIVQKPELLKKIMGERCGDIDPSSSSFDQDRLRYLESKIAEIEEANSCSICMERVKNVVFLCGHGACVTCANALKACHMCRKTIITKINVY